MQENFYDINKLPTTTGTILMGISMSRIGNSQSPEKCFEYLDLLAKKIQYSEGITLQVLYGDYLYLNSEDPAYMLRDRFKDQMISHKNGFINMLKKDRVWTLKAFSFKTFGQLMLDNSDIIQEAMRIIWDLYSSDTNFKNAVDMDCKNFNHGFGEREVKFIIEEIVIFYLAQMGKLKFYNNFVTDSENNWVLQVYPGEPLQSEVYLFKLNPLNLSSPTNPYANAYYNLDLKKLIYYS